MFTRLCLLQHALRVVPSLLNNLYADSPMVRSPLHCGALLWSFFQNPERDSAIGHCSGPGGGGFSRSFAPGLLVRMRRFDTFIPLPTDVFRPCSFCWMCVSGGRLFYDVSRHDPDTPPGVLCHFQLMTCCSCQFHIFSFFMWANVTCVCGRFFLPWYPLRVVTSSLPCPDALCSSLRSFPHHERPDFDCRTAVSFDRVDVLPLCRSIDDDHASAIFAF